MNFLNVNIPIKNKPVLDEGFVPLGLFFKHFNENATKPVVIVDYAHNKLSFETIISSKLKKDLYIQ